VSASSPATIAETDVPSPCISVCTLDAGGQVCTGCFRTLDEIAGWIEFSAAEKRAIVASLPARRAAAQRS